MKASIILFFFMFMGYFAFSQDVIVKRNGDKIEAKVLEITETAVKYQRFDQPDGPTRSIEKSELKEVIYENGTWDDFQDYENKEEEKAEPVESRARPSSSGPDRLFKSGLFIEGMLSINNRSLIETFSETYQDVNGNIITNTSEYSNRASMFGINFRLGSKWYFGGWENYRIGFQATWLRFGAYIGTDLQDNLAASAFFAPANVGLANVFKFTDKVGMEVNANVGYAILDFVPIPDDFQGFSSILYGAEVKFRYGALAAGIDISHLRAFIPNARDNSVLMSLTIGAKF